MQFGEEADRFHRTGVVQRIDGFLDNLLILTFIQLALFATANQQNALREYIGHMMQQQRLTDFPLKFAAAQQGADITVADFIQLLGDR